MAIASMAEHLLTMATTMVLWIINDYEDEDLKGRCREIVEHLEKLHILLNKEQPRQSPDGY